MNHKKIADGFSLALAEMSSDLRYVMKKFKIADSPEMRELVVELYVKVFKFLCHSMSYFKSRRNRLTAAFNKNFYDDTVKKMVYGVQRTVLEIDREANTASGTQIKEILGIVRNTAIELGVAGNESRTDDKKTTANKLNNIGEGLTKLGNISAKYLVSVEEHVLHGK